MNSVRELYSDVWACRQCPEFSEYHKFAPDCHGNGVGESSHKPSIDAGKYYAQGSVRSLLAGIVDLEKDCYLSDAIKCDKQFCFVKGKVLDTVAQRCCTKFLSPEIRLLQPKGIVAVGRIAFEFLTGITGNFISRQDDGKKYLASSSNIPVYPVIHPSYANMYYGRVPWQNVSYAQSFAHIVRRCF